jgi:hypothetical protein
MNDNNRQQAVGHYFKHHFSLKAELVVEKPSRRLARIAKITAVIQRTSGDIARRWALRYGD